MEPSDFWLFLSLNKRINEVHFTCDEEVQAAMKKLFQEWVRKTCSALVALYRITGTQYGKIRYKTKVHILSYILCIVSLQCIVWMQKYKCGCSIF
jgi:hypothetical protein